MEHVKQNLKWYFLGGLFIVTIFIWGVVLYEDRGGVLTVAFLDVGQGDSIFIESPNGNQVLIDGGSNKKVLRELGEIMSFYDRSINVVIATHPDKDHSGGLVPVLENFSVDIVIEPGVESDTKIYQSFEDIIEEKEIKRILARRDMVVVLDRKNGIYLSILFPNQDVSGWDKNDASIVAKLIYKDTSFLLTGDSPKGIESYLVYTDGPSLKTDVLKLGHHGSKTSSSEAFLQAANPLYAIISAGENNRYGHPHKEVLDRLEKLNISYLATYEEGTITFQSDGKEITLK